MNELMKFEFEGKAVRTATNENGMTEWMGKEVAVALGYKNPQRAIRNHCKADGCSKRSLIDSKGRKQIAPFINEANLYRLITSSKLPSAEKFEKWVFETVLPSIRKHGAYVAPTISPEQFANLQAKYHNALIEAKHWQVKAEIESNTARAWEAHSIYGSISPRNGLPKREKIRGFWRANRNFKDSVSHDFEQMFFKYIN